MCHFCLIQLLLKFPNSWYQLHPVGSRFLLQSSEVHFQVFTSLPHTCTQLYISCKHSKFKLFFSCNTSLQQFCSFFQFLVTSSSLFQATFCFVSGLLLKPSYFLFLIPQSQRETIGEKETSVWKICYQVCPKMNYSDNMAYLKIWHI